MKAPVATAAAVESDLLTAPYSALLESLEKKREYLNKRIEKLNKLNDDSRNGVALTDVQEDARKKLPEVEAQVDHLKRLSKQVKEQQRDYNRQKKHREAAHAVHLEEVRKTTVVDALTARHVCEEYIRPQGQLRYSSSFTEEERVRLFYVASIFVPHAENSSELRQEIAKNAATVSAILRKDPIFEVCNGFSGADAYHLLDSLVSVVENSDQDLSDSSVCLEVSLEKLGKDDAYEPMDEDEINEDDVVIPAPDEAVDDVRFGYSSDDDGAKDSEVSTEAVAPSSVDEDTSDTPADSEDSIVPADPDTRMRSVENPIPNTRDQSVDSMVGTEMSNPVETAAPEPKVTENATVAVAKEAKPQSNHGRRNHHKNIRFENGPRPGGQRRFNNSTAAGKPHGHEAGNHSRPRDGPANNYKRNTGGNTAASNGHPKSSGYGQNNGYNKHHAYNNAGYVRRGGYVRPPPGTCGFILQVDQ